MTKGQIILKIWAFIVVMYFVILPLLGCVFRWQETGVLSMDWGKFGLGILTASLIGVLPDVFISNWVEKKRNQSRG